MIILDMIAGWSPDKSGVARRANNPEVGNFEKKRLKRFLKYDRGVEQLVARWAHNPEVVGSNPSPATIKPPKRRLFLFCFACKQLDKMNYSGII